MTEEKIQVHPAIHQHIQKQDKIISDLRTNLPDFYHLEMMLSKKSDDPSLSEFYKFIVANHQESTSQLFQDLFVAFFFGQKEGGSFLEFGATDGISLSNSFFLENHLKWKGVLAEPSPQWHQDLTSNRPDSQLVFDCIWAETGLELDFFVSDVGELSTLNAYRESDKVSMPGLTANRIKSGHNVKVKTTSLNDIFVEFFDSSPIDYMSVDTEGSELAILSNFDFEKFGPSILTIEHNFTALQDEIDALLFTNGYVRRFKDFTAHDAWYVKPDIFD